MPNIISEQKTLIRKECRKDRQALESDFRKQASQAICVQIENWPVFQQTQVILTYMPVKSEVDLRSLIEKHPGKSWVLPRILPEENHRMLFHAYDPQQLIIHPFGMAEPASSSPLVAPGKIQLALVPGLAFDRNGWRLGYGGGYFDRFLKEFTGVSLGVTFEELLLEHIPHDAHDMPMQWLVSEMKLYRASS